MDAATWAKEFEGVAKSLQDRGEVGAARVIRKLLTLHAQAVAAVEQERDRYQKQFNLAYDEAKKALEQARALKHTLEMWDRECGGLSPREFVAQAVREEREAWESTIPSEWFQMVEDRRTALRARGPQEGAAND